MKKILILTSYYLPNASANGINTMYIVNELKRRGNKVFLISLKRKNEKSFEYIDSIPVYRITPSIYSRIIERENSIKTKNYSFLNKAMFKLLRLLRLLKMMFLVFKFPNTDILQTNKTYKNLKKLHEVEKFDCVIGVFKPYSNIAAVRKFNRKHDNVICGAYYLDLISSLKKPFGMPNKIYKKLCRIGDIKTFKDLDFMLIAKSGRVTYDKEEYKNFQEKIEYVDFPTFQSLHNEINKTKSDKSLIDITFAGTLDINYRNPLLLLESLKLTKQKIRLNIFGKGNCDDIFNQFKNIDSLQIVQHGTVTRDKVIKAMLESDFLVNITNEIDDAVPSKIFEMFGTGKPILNLSFKKDDVTTDYFKKYPSVFTIKAWEALEEQISYLNEFLAEEYGKTYNMDDIKEKFIQNTPEYTVDIITKKIVNN